MTVIAQLVCASCLPVSLAVRLLFDTHNNAYLMCTDVYIHHTAGYGGGGYPNAYPGGQQGGNGVSHMHHNSNNNSSSNHQQQQHGGYGGYMNSSDSGRSGRGDYSSGAPHSSVRLIFWNYLKRITSYSSVCIHTKVCVYT
jgi:hypothetical protein